MSEKNYISWDEVTKSYKSILIGNGFSINISENFKYDTLLDKCNLNSDTKKIFTRNETSNFEFILRKINDFLYLGKSLNISNDSKNSLSNSYSNIKEELIKTVHNVHPSYDKINSRLEKIAPILLSFERIFTTNYDLLLYWSLMNSQKKFNDLLFWTENKYSKDKESYKLCFTKKTPKTGNTIIYYLHGSLFIKEYQGGRVQKLSRVTNLLEDIRESFDLGQTPLFVSEGTSEDKLNTINKSSYLCYCLDKFQNDINNLVIAGHSLSPKYDNHLIDALKSKIDAVTSFKIAIGIKKNITRNIDDWKSFFDEQLSKNAMNKLKLEFFDVNSCPLFP
ncbi:MAG: DUF4917 family protein [Ignavibacteriae bacterium]|nr:DUF4917 family protein [Ignavibacteriota bacterium]